MIVKKMDWVCRWDDRQSVIGCNQVLSTQVMRQARQSTKVSSLTGVNTQALDCQFQMSKSTNPEVYHKNIYDSLIA